MDARREESPKLAESWLRIAFIVEAGLLDWQHTQRDSVTGAPAAWGAGTRYLWENSIALHQMLVFTSGGYRTKWAVRADVGVVRWARGYGVLAVHLLKCVHKVPSLRAKFWCLIFVFPCRKCGRFCLISEQTAFA